ncbi:Vancomycin resistance protein YoaR, contains peptidoglycan-binding and VanW domains [Paenibacillus sp. UNC496MF]|uniref:VanW family protein n=1 Tax=Paenibacillus sp. UNC496MF TaxID=1502753 RepID=UPI0008E339F1|nr:VanW family protein [Paenibacillus sp. UNC496MF]SFJ36160.1 Vancomycin resistance protein YoaR, contains peptidoglycan-binding and VanW domains [Paenibacillus sp. UNC496MF]
MKWLWITGLMRLLQPGIDDGQPDEQLSVGLRGQNAVVIHRADYASPGFTMVDLDKFDRLVEQLKRRSYEAPRNAIIGDHGGIVAEQLGYRLDQAQFTEKFYAYFYGTGASAIDAPLAPVYPRVDRELLAEIKEKPIGHYATYYNSRNKNRSHNIRLAAQAINNTVIFPGETFSFNKVVGERTREKGYLEAPVIVRGELSEGIGGGICQVSSTLFNASDRAGLQIVKRYSHSRSVPYVRSGRDATVSWNGPDFAFENQYNQPILIRALAVPGKLYVSIYSSDVIEYKPRNVPGMTFGELPEEVPASAGDGERLP